MFARMHAISTPLQWHARFDSTIKLLPYRAQIDSNIAGKVWLYCPTHMFIEIEPWNIPTNLFIVDACAHELLMLFYVNVNIFMVHNIYILATVIIVYIECFDTISCIYLITTVKLSLNNIIHTSLSYKLLPAKLKGDKFIKLYAGNCYLLKITKDCLTAKSFDKQ